MEDTSEELKKLKIKIAPSILSADFSNLAYEIKSIEKHSDLLHIDIMDGHFVPNITIGPAVVSSIRKHSKLSFDVHLMISDPLKYAPLFVKAGANIISFHGELFPNPDELKGAVMKVKKMGVKVGLALNPDKPLTIIKSVLSDLDLVLIMGVYAGFGGQEFIPETIEKIKELRDIFSGEIEVDGGINDKTAKIVTQAGADILVSGSYIFKSHNRVNAIESLR